MSLNKLKNVNAVVTLIHQRIPKIQQTKGVRKTVPNRMLRTQLSASRSASFLENYSTRVSSRTQIIRKPKSKNVDVDGLPIDNNDQHDKHIIKIERNISRLKVRAAEAEELQVVRMALSKLYTDSQEEIKRVKSEKESSLNKSAEVLSKLMVCILSYKFMNW